MALLANDVVESAPTHVCRRWPVIQSREFPPPTYTVHTVAKDDISSLALSRHNQLRCRRQVFQGLPLSHTHPPPVGEPDGSLNHAGLVTPLGRLRALRLLPEGVKKFKDIPKDSPVLFPCRLKNLLEWWSKPGRLGHTTTWVKPPPSLTLTTDALDTGWRYQSSRGHRDQGSWTPSDSTWHINTKDLATVW